VTRTLIGNKVYDGQKYVAAVEAAGENALPVMLMPPCSRISIWNVTLPSVMRFDRIPRDGIDRDHDADRHPDGLGSEGFRNAEAPKQAG
jgi:hypothetical protein